MNFRHLAAACLVLLISGCGSMSLENKRVDYKSAAEIKSTSLEVPPDLTVPVAGDQYAIPEPNSAAASYSDFARNGAAQVIQSAAVVPEHRSVSLKHDGAHRWLLVNDKAENLWPLLRDFLKENGFVIKIDNPQAGILETDWAENREKIPKNGVRKILGKVFDNLYDSGEKDMYRIRVERSEDGNATEIYLTQYGTEKVLSPDKTLTVWQSRPNDPDLEAAMTQILMAKLGGELENQRNVPGNVPDAGEEATFVPKLQTRPDGEKIILLAESFDRSWRAVGIALDHSGFVVEDKDRTRGLYFLRAEVKQQKKGWSKLAFWKNSEESKPMHYQVFVHEAGKNCEVGSHDSEGGNDATSQSIIDELFNNISKQ